MSTCQTCSAPLIPTGRQGRPASYCEAHAPSRRGYTRRYYAARRSEILDYHRQRYNHRPIEDRVCTHLCHRKLGLPCDIEFRGWTELCRLCRRSGHATWTATDGT